jgi:membrane associated rhomboid family serine protease
VLPIRDLNPTRHATIVTWVLVAACIGVFFLVQPRTQPDATEFLYERATIPCEITTGHPLTFEEVRTGTCDDRPGQEVAPGKQVYLSLLTAIFLHGSLMHLLGNVWILWIFGNNVEDDIGSVRFALFYLLAGLAASIGHVVVYRGDTTPVVGASGAIAGVMGAYLVLHPWAKVVSIVPPLFFLPFVVPAAVYLLLWFGLQFLLADQDTNIAWEAHVFGFGFGVLAALWFRASGTIERRRSSGPTPAWR